jgi:hypothetical protein
MTPGSGVTASLQARVGWRRSPSMITGSPADSRPIDSRDEVQPSSVAARAECRHATGLHAVPRTRPSARSRKRFPALADAGRCPAVSSFCFWRVVRSHRIQRRIASARRLAPDAARAGRRQGQKVGQLRWPWHTAILSAVAVAVGSGLATKSMDTPSDTQGMESNGSRKPMGESPGSSHRISSSRRNQGPLVHQARSPHHTRSKARRNRQSHPGLVEDMGQSCCSRGSQRTFRRDVGG